MPPPYGSRRRLRPTFSASSTTKRVEQALRIALDNGLDEHAGRAHVALVFWSPRGRRYASADRHLAAGLRFCDERGMDLWRAYLLAYRARSELDRGWWDDAVGSATLFLDDPRNSPVPRVIALAVVGLIRARRGEPGVWEPLEAWALARETGELQRIEPVVAARAEAFWLERRHGELLEEVAFALDLASARGANWVIGEMTSLATPERRHTRTPVRRTGTLRQCARR